MVSRRQPGFQPDFAGLALYDGNTLLAQLDSFFGSADSIAFIDRSTLIGCSNLQSPSELIPIQRDLDCHHARDVCKRRIDGAARTRIAFGSGRDLVRMARSVNAATWHRSAGTVARSSQVLRRRSRPRIRMERTFWFLSVERDGHGFRTLTGRRSTASNHFARPLTGSNASALVRVGLRPVLPSGPRQALPDQTAEPRRRARPGPACLPHIPSPTGRGGSVAIRDPVWRSAPPRRKLSSVIRAIQIQVLVIHRLWEFDSPGGPGAVGSRVTIGAAVNSRRRPQRPRSG